MPYWKPLTSNIRLVVFVFELLTIKEKKNKMSKNYKLAMVLTARIVNDDVLKDTLILTNARTHKSQVFDSFRKSVSNKYHDEMMTAVINEKKTEFFTEAELRDIMRENCVDECRVEFYHSDD